MLTRGLTQYGFHTTLLAFHHECVADTAPHTGHTRSQRVKELWSDFFYNEWSYHFMEHIEEFIKKTGRSLPIWPAIGAIERSQESGPRIFFRRKLEAENRKRKSRILAPCGCRVSWGHQCDLPLMTCFACSTVRGASTT